MSPVFLLLHCKSSSMPLQTQVSSRLSEDAAILYIQDATGNYSGSNPTGWGSPNFAKTDIGVIIMVEVYQITGGPVYHRILTNEQLIDYLAGDEIALAASDFEFDEVFPSGQLAINVVYPMSYSVPGGDSGDVTTVSIVKGSTTITRVSGPEINTVLQPDAAIYFVELVEGLSGTVDPFYYVDTSKTITGETATLEKAAPNEADVLQYGLLPVITATSVVLNNHDVEVCVLDAIGKLAGEPDLCKDDVDRVTFLTIMKFGIDVQSQSGNYQAASQIRTVVNSNCTNCGC